MGLRWIESFEGIGTTALLAAKYDAAESALSTSGVSGTWFRTGSQSLRMTASDVLCSKALGTGNPTCIQGFALFVPAASLGPLNTTADFAQVREGSIVHGALGISYTSGSTFKFTIKRGTTVLNTTVSSFDSNTTYWIEFKYTVDNATGAYELRVDTVNVLSGSATDTQNAGTATWDRFALRSPFLSGAAPVYYDDWYVFDAAGATDNNFAGIRQVFTQLFQADAIGAGDFGESAPSTGSDRGAMVDETTPNSDTDYNTFTGVQKDGYIHGAFTFAGSIDGVQWNYTTRKTDAGACTYRGSTRRGGTTNLGLTQTPLTTYAVQSQVMENDLQTGAHWTLANLNNTQVVIERLT